MAGLFNTALSSGLLEDLRQRRQLLLHLLRVAFLCDDIEKGSRVSVRGRTSVHGFTCSRANGRVRFAARG